MTHRLTLLLAASLLALGSMAQDNQHTLTLDAQLRTRGEYDNGAVTPRSEHERSALGVGERARLTMHYEHGITQLHATAQHTGLWGQRPLSGTDDRFALSEAWARIGMGQSMYVQVGRQTLSYDDERLLGASDWSHTGSTHDALRLGYRSNATEADAIVAVNRSEESRGTGFYPDLMPYKNMVAVWAHHRFDALPLAASLIYINTGLEAGTARRGSTRHLQTMGTHLTYAEEPYDAHLSLYYQAGHTAAGISANAFMVSLGGEWRALPQVSIHAGYDYLSGNDGRNINEHAFTPLYGTHHRFFGAMDYFTSRLTCGLQDINLGVTTDVHQLSPDWELIIPLKVTLDYHRFLAAESYRGMSKGLGHEVDLQLSCRPSSDITLSGGYSVMLASASMDLVKGGSHSSWQDWAWLQLSVNPRLLFTRW